MLVTVAIPTFNRLDYLKQCVESALAQSYPHLEVLVSDDGSSDGTFEWCAERASADSRLRYQRNEINRGLAGNWNALADGAHGEYMMLLGDDDRLLPSCVERLINGADEEPHVVFSNHYLIDTEGRRLEEESRMTTRQYRRDELPAGKLTNAAAVVWQNSVPIPSLLHTETIRRLRFKEDLNCPEIELFARLAEEDGVFVFVPEYLAEYRSHPQSATSTGLRGEKLALYLLRIAVSPEVEPHKETFMANLLVASTTRCLQQRDRALARYFLSHHYYPRALNNPRLVATRIIQNLCVRLPDPLGHSIFNVFHASKRELLGRA